MADNRITFTDSDNTRKTLRFGRLNQREFGIVKTRVDRLVSAKLSGDPPDRETTVWLSTVSEYIREKLAEAGLIEARKSKTLGGWLTEYFDKRKNDKKATLDVLERTRRKLLDHFGENRSLRSITAGDAVDWRRAILESGLNENTTRKSTAAARQFFKAAIAHKLIEENPFAGLPTTLIIDDSRFYFVTTSEALAALECFRTNEQKLVFALARWGGLRTPSEPLALRWTDVNWEKGRIIINSPKTGVRVIPMFPELRPYLERAFEQAPDGAEFVLQERDHKKIRMRTLERAMLRRGVAPWPKFFQNLRSTRETELVESYPLHVVVKWIGNSQAIARKHYLQVTDAHFERASQKPSQHQPERSRKSKKAKGAEVAGTQVFS